MREIKFRMWNGERMFEEEELYSYPMSLLNSYTLYEKGYRFMQYTGLKDIKGKEIYEGDIVSNGITIIYTGGKKQTFNDVGVVRWDVKNCCIVLNNKNSTKRLTHKTTKQYGVEVIGNIHDNPELLEVQE